MTFMSDLRIDREGNWHYRGMEMTRRDIVRLFYEHLVQSNSGQFFVDLGKERAPVDVEDAPYTVRAVCARNNGLHLLLSDDSLEELDAATLQIGGNNVPYCRVKRGAFAARFSTPGYYQIAESIEFDEKSDSYFLRCKGQLHLL